MRLESFWAKGYRSLRDVELKAFGSFNVFYGPNGGGKSNVLSAMGTLFRLLEVIGRSEEGSFIQARRFPDGAEQQGAIKAAKIAHGEGGFAKRDFCLYAPKSELILGATLGGFSIKHASTGDDVPLTLHLEITLDWQSPNPLLWLSRSRVEFLSAGFDNHVHLSNVGVYDGKALTTAEFSDPEKPPLRFLRSVLNGNLRRDGSATSSFTMVDAIRSLRPEPDTLNSHNRGNNILLQNLKEGRLATALFSAKNASDPRLRKTFQALQSLLAGEPLVRPPFDVLRDIETTEISIRERLSRNDGDEREIPLDLSGLGVVQLYTILAKVLFSGAAVIGLEEPEAHLHGPTSGLHLRKLLRRLIDESHIQQLFIATHSNLFDLDPNGYFDVRLDPTNGTIIERQPIHALDQHLYEPGPTLHALGS